MGKPGGLGGGQMYFPRFLVGAVCALMILLAWAYISTWSVWYSVILAAVGALALQLGYFLAVIYLIIRSDSVKREQLSVTDEKHVNLSGRAESSFR